MTCESVNVYITKQDLNKFGSLLVYENRVVGIELTYIVFFRKLLIIV